MAHRRVKFPLIPAVWGVLTVVLRVASADPAPDPPPETLKLSPGNHATPEIPKTVPDGFAVLPFANRSGVAGMSWMSAGIPALLADKLAAHPGLRRLTPPEVFPSGVAPPADQSAERALAVQVATASGARLVFAGSVRRPSWTFELTLRAYEVLGANATLLGEEVVLGEFSSYSALLDKALKPLLAKAGRPLLGEAIGKVGRIPTKDFYAFTLYGRGLMALHGLGKGPQLQPAEEALKKTTFIDPKFSEAHRLLAVVYRGLGEKIHARGQFQWALDLDPESYAALSGLIHLNRDEREGEDSLAAVERALFLRPDDLAMRQLHGEMLWEAGLSELAFKELSRLLVVQPANVSARRLMVLIRASHGTVEELVHELETLVKLDPDDLLAKLDLAAAYRRLDRDADAITMYEAVLAKDPKHLQALKFLGDLYKAKKNMKKAIAMYERALASNRNDPRPYFLLGEAYSSVGDVRSAERVYLKAQRFRKYMADAYNDLGAIYYRRGDYSAALWYLQKAVKSRPNRANVHYNLGLTLSASGGDRRERALSELRVAADLDPEDAEIRYATGVVLLRLGHLEAAEAAFKDALSRAPDHAAALQNLRLIADLRKRATEGEADVR